MLRIATVRAMRPALGMRAASNLPAGVIQDLPATYKTEEQHTVEVSDISAISGVPKYILERQYRIYKPARNCMQSGSFNTQRWKIEANVQNRWINPLMGWTSSGDAIGNLVSLEFETKEAAVEFATRQGYNFYVDEPLPNKPRHKSYGDNFSWNSRLRTSTK
eukprot:Colp12_sorted_trinity150504_noHs@24309